MGLEDLASDAVLRVAARSPLDPATRTGLVRGLGGSKPYRWPPSRNIVKLCEAARTGDAVFRTDWREARLGLDWWEWAAGEPLGRGEDYTVNLAYYVWHPGATELAAVAANEAVPRVERAEEVAHALRVDLRAYIAISTICVAGPCGLIRDYGSAADRTRLVRSVGPPVAGPPLVAQPGKRGWVRSGEDRVNGPLLGLDDRVEGHLLHRAAGLPADRRLSRWMHDLREALGRGFPAWPAFGLSAAERSLVRAQLSDHLDLERVRTLLSWIEESGAPERAVHVVCYVDGSVQAWIEFAPGSSTGTLAYVGWDAERQNAEWASWDYGQRDHGQVTGNVTTGRVVEEDDRLLISSDERDEPPLAVTKFRKPVRWRALLGGGRTGLVYPIEEPSQPTPPSDPPPRRTRFPWGDVF